MRVGRSLPRLLSRAVILGGCAVHHSRAEPDAVERPSLVCGPVFKTGDLLREQWMAGSIPVLYRSPSGRCASQQREPRRLRVLVDDDQPGLGATESISPPLEWECACALHWRVRLPISCATEGAIPRFPAISPHGPWIAESLSCRRRVPLALEGADNEAPPGHSRAAAHGCLWRH